MLFFLPPAMVIIYGLDYFARKRSIQFLLALMTVFLMAAEGHTVYLRNDLFQDDKIFWSDNVQKAPNLSRPHGNLGVSLFSEGDYPWAFNEFTTALRLANDPNLRMPATWHHNLGTYYLRVEADADKALFHLTEALNIKRAVKVYRQMGLEYDQMALAMLMKGRLDLAEHYSLRAIGYESNNATYHSNLALILLKGGKLDASMRMARRALVLRDNYSGAMNSLAEALRRKGHLARAAVYWERVLQNSPSNINAHLALVEIYHRMGQKQRAVQVVGRLMDLKGERSMNDLFRVEKEYFVAYVPDPKIIKPIFKDILLAVSREVGHAERHLQKLDK
jgi:tetratricopeptide (TPR) repeat protein